MTLSVPGTCSQRKRRGCFSSTIFIFLHDRLCLKKSLKVRVTTRIRKIVISGCALALTLHLNAKAIRVRSIRNNWAQRDRQTGSASASA